MRDMLLVAGLSVVLSSLFMVFYLMGVKQSGGKVPTLTVPKILRRDDKDEADEEMDKIMAGFNNIMAYDGTPQKVGELE